MVLAVQLGLVRVAMQDTSLPGTRFWEEKARAVQKEEAMDRNRVLLHSVIVLALAAFAITVSTVLARLGG